MALSVGEQVRWWGIGFAVFLALVWVFADVLLPYLAGFAIAYFLDPLADRLEAKGASRIFASVVIFLLFLAIVLIALLILIPALITQVRNLIELTPVITETFVSFLSAQYPELLEEGSWLYTAFDTLKLRAQDWSLALLGQAWSGGLKLVNYLMLAVITPVVAFYLLLDWDRIVARIDGWLPLDHRPVIRRIASEIDQVLAGFLRGQMTVCFILGVFYAVALALVGLKFGLVIGLFAGLISFIPFVGSIVGGALSLGVAMFQFWGSPELIAAVAIIFVIGQTIEGNFLTPKLVGSSVGLHPVWLMFALSAFGLMLGFIGLLIAVPAAAAIGVVGRFLLERYQEGRLYQGLVGREQADLDDA